MADFTIKRGDRLPALKMTLADETGTAVNLSTATVRVVIGRPGRLKVDATATIVDAAAGRIRYDWATADTDTEGTYFLEAEVLFADGRRMTCPNDGFKTIRVVGDLT